MVRVAHDRHVVRAEAVHGRLHVLPLVVEHGRDHAVDGEAAVVAKHALAGEVQLQRLGQGGEVRALRLGQAYAVVRRAEALALRGVEHQPVPVAVHRAAAAPAQQVQHLVDGRALAQHVAEEVDFVDSARVDVGKNGLQRRKVSVHVGEKGGAAAHAGSSNFS